MKLSKALLGAILVGMTVQITGCKKDDPTPKDEQVGKSKKAGATTPANCPACGMG